MMKSSRTGWIIFVALVLLLVAGVWHLFQLRFAAGDAYPPYSSLRADPLGTKALHDSLKELPGLSVERWLQESDNLPPGGGKTFFLLGVPPWALQTVDRTEAEDTERFVREGGRFIITLKADSNRAESKHDRERRERREREMRGETNSPVASVPPVPAKQEPKKDQPDKKSTDQKNEDDDDDEPRQPVKKAKAGGRMPFVSLPQYWGWKTGLVPLDEQDGAWQSTTVLRDGLAPAALPSSLPWHSPLVFTNLTSDWTAIYARSTNVVAMERRIGKGSVVILSDSYLVSNEALQNDRAPAMLAWLLGSNRQVYFDETHLGVQSNPGVATLIRKYRLEGVVFSFVLLGVLFIWRNATSLVPPYEEGGGPGGNVVTGRDSVAGFVNLLRRSVPTRRLPSTCVNEWKRTWGAGRPDRERKIAEVEQLLQAENSAEKARPVNWYREVCQRLRHTAEKPRGS